ncbi:MAG TPA: aminotransferase class V-fold PLP-dependent enzyme [Firmicutes bacterium]|jgi:selenocysteine lyase/cysteine desulfurase|nr:aminotransferase class V-fold PLP-dependent enzyme [Bacillota bacterium]
MEKKWHNRIRKDILGIDLKVPLVDGAQRPYINLDNAATTPPLLPVVQTVQAFLPWYSSVHRGFGYKSQLSTEVYHEARRQIMTFFGAPGQEYIALFVKNTSEGLNKLAARLPAVGNGEVISTWMEHHSNDLPWRLRKEAEFIELTGEGCLDLADLESKLKKGRRRYKLVTVCGASNVTGIINPLQTIAELAHHYGAQIAVDAAQLAPHYPIRLRTAGAEPIDYISLSGHKIYAPFGTGVLFGPVETFRAGTPDQVGGGGVIAVSREEVVFAPLPDREEVGTPNLIGALALATALRWLAKNGFERIAAYERKLTKYAYDGLKTVPGLILYGPPPERYPRIGVISFNLEGIPHGLVAAYLAFEAGIGVRHGCFCARPYVHHLLGLTKDQILSYENLAKAGRKCLLPGMVRVSFGFYNTEAEIDLLVAALKNLREEEGKIKNRYQIDPATGEYLPKIGDFKGALLRHTKTFFHL